jgi:type II secretion system protein N
MSTTAHHQTGEALPRALIAIGVPCAGVLLVAFFMIRGFPYDVLGELIANRIEQSHGIQLTFVDVGLTLQFAGPALEATQLRAKFPDRPPQQIDRALIRPAWSLSWFVGEPVIHVELESPSGNADGTLRWNGVTSWAGTIRDARPELPPIADWIPTGGFEGNLEATLDVSVTEQGPEGWVEFEIQDGSISVPGVSFPLPFKSLTGEVNLGGDAYATLTSLSLEGPDVSGSGSGKIGRAERLEQAPIGFEFKLDVKPTISRAVMAAGVKVSPGGKAIPKISGTVEKPKIR